MADQAIGQWRFSVRDVPTDVVRISYSNRIFMLVSQTGKMGTIIHVYPPEELGGRTASVEAHTLIGHRNDDALDVCARRVYETTCAAKGVPLVLSLALADYSPANLTALIAELQTAVGSEPGKARDFR